MEELMSGGTVGLASNGNLDPEGKQIMSLESSIIIPVKTEGVSLDLNNNDETDVLLPPNANAVEMLQWDPRDWSSEGAEVTTLTNLNVNLLVDPMFLPFDQDCNKVDWEPTSSSDPLSDHQISQVQSDLIWAPGSEDSLLRTALQPGGGKLPCELRKVLSYPPQVILSDVTLNDGQPSISSSTSSSSTYYELLVEPEVVIPTHVEEISQQHLQPQKTLTISTTTHSNNSLSAKWTYTTTNANGTPKPRKRSKKQKLVPTSTSPTVTVTSTTTLTAVSASVYSPRPSSSPDPKPTSTSGKDETIGSRKERSLHYCTVCQKGFKDKYSVNVHVRTHTGEKPFACSLCGKSFRQKAHLAKHYQTHAAKAANGGNTPIKRGKSASSNTNNSPGINSTTTTVLPPISNLGINPVIPINNTSTQSS